MMHVTYADKSFILGDEAARTALGYAALLARQNSADTVSLHAISSDGDEVNAVVLLDAGAPIMAETAVSSMPEPENGEAVAYMKAQMERFTQTTNVQPADPADAEGDFDHDEV